MHVIRSTAKLCEYVAEPSCGERVLPLFFNHVLQNCAIKRQIGNDCFELGVLVAQLAKLTNLRRAERSESFLPDVEGGFRNAELSGDVGHKRFDLGLSESGGDLFVGVAGFAHGANLLAVG